jgi:cytochrome-b5 reductase
LTPSQIVHVLDKAPSNWPTPAGYITRDTITQHIAGPEGGERVKVLVCGPPGQVAAVAGKKDGMKQGALGGVLKELGYKEDQVFKF